MNFYQRWAYFRGYICTANADGSIPLNAMMVADVRGTPENEAQRLVDMHNELTTKLEKAARQS